MFHLPASPPLRRPRHRQRRVPPEGLTSASATSGPRIYRWKVPFFALEFWFTDFPTSCTYCIRKGSEISATYCWKAIISGLSPEDLPSLRTTRQWIQKDVPKRDWPLFYKNRTSGSPFLEAKGDPEVLLAQRTPSSVLGLFRSSSSSIKSVVVATAHSV